MSGRVLAVFEVAAPVAAGVLLLLLLANVWVTRVPYPFDLEWMEGGMLAHAWRLDQGLPLYVAPNPDFVPYIYPPGYSAVLAVFGKVFGLSPALGRVVSLFGTLAAAAAVPFVVTRHSARHSGVLGKTPGQVLDSRVVAFCAAVAFLGTYPHTGAFFDLVRPDGLYVGLVAWAIAIGLEDDRRAPIVAGLLLWLAFLTKHNAAAFGLPIALGIGVRSGWREAGRFAAAAAVPALLSVAFLQWTSEGRFLTYLLKVPASHPTVEGRIWPGTPRELGTPLPIATGVVAMAFLWLGMTRQRTFPLPATTFGPVGAGMVVAAFGTYLVPPPDSGLYNFPSSVAFWAMGAVPVSLGLYAVGSWLDRREGLESGPVVNWRWVFGIGITLTALAMSGVMRAHNGGFLNVHIPTFWVMCVGFGLVVDRALAEIPTRPIRLLAAGVLTAQSLWAMAMLDGERLKPTDADRELGERFVAEIAAVEGPVLSPFAAWLPVYAGKPPSLHYMGVWDLDYPGGPFRPEVQVIRDAVRDHHWALILGGSQKFPYGTADAYDTRQTLVETKDHALMPKTGWPARPNRLLTPTVPEPEPEPVPEPLEEVGVVTP